MSRCEAKFSPFEGSGNIWPGNDIALMHNLRTRGWRSGCKLSLGSQDRLDLTWTWTWSGKSFSRVFHGSQQKTLYYIETL